MTSNPQDSSPYSPEIEEQFDQFSEQLVDSYQEISILQEASEALGQLLDRDSIAAATLAAALRVSDAARGGFFVLEEDHWKRLASVGNVADRLPEDWVTILESRSRPLIQNRPDRGRLAEVRNAAPDASDLLVAPLVGQENLVGILALFDSGHGSFESGDAKMVQAIAKQAATALNNEKHHRQLLRAQEDLLTTQKLAAMGEMAAEIGHELNNYLTSILGQTEIIQVLIENDHFKDLGPRLHSIVTQVDKMSVLTLGLLRCSRQEVKPKACGLQDIVQESVDFVSPQNRFENTRFQVSIPDDLPTICVDPNQIQQVFLNLFTNAADAMGKAGGTISVSAEAGFSGNSIEIIVSDEGFGIPESLHTRIFEPRFTTKSHGNGVGLAVCFRVIHDHGGTIHLVSPQGGGAVFRISLPTPSPSAQDSDKPIATGQSGTESFLRP